jgi:hypothetical protein
MGIGRDRQCLKNIRRQTERGKIYSAADLESSTGIGSNKVGRECQLCAIVAIKKTVELDAANISTKFKC